MGKRQLRKHEHIPAAMFNYTTNGTIGGGRTAAAALESPIKKRAIDVRPAEKPARHETAAHPIVTDGPFLDVGSTAPTSTARTRRTRRPTKPAGPAVFLTNPNVPVETTTLLQRRELRPLDKDDPARKEDESAKQAADLGKSPQLQNASESLAVSPPVLSTTGSTLLDRNWLQFLQEAMLFSSPGLGMLLGFPLLSWALRRVGARWVIAGCLLLSTACVLLQPTAIASGQLWTCGLRVLHGVTCSPIFTFIGTNAAHWATLKEQLSFLTASLSAILLGPAVSWLFVIRLIDVNDPDHLQYFHYLLAASTSIVALLWAFFYNDEPEEHRWIEANELNRIVTGKSQNNRLVDQKVAPLLLKSVSTWSLFIVAFAYFAAFAVLANFLPIYAITVLGVERPAPTTVLTFLAPVALHLCCLALHKTCRGLSTSLQVRLFNSIGFVACGLLFVVLAALPPGDHFVGTSRSILTIVLLPLGFSTLGFIYSAVVYGRFFTQFILANLQAPFALAMTVVPFMIVFFTVDNLLRYWRLTFLIVAVLMFLAALAFGVLIRGQPASWAEHSWNPAQTYKMRDLRTIDRDDECGLMEVRRVEDAHHKGIVPPIAAETPKRAVKFFTFQQYKEAFVSDRLPTWATLSLAGLCSGLTEAVVICPFEVVKVRLQSDRTAVKAEQKTTGAVAREIIRQHGFFGKGLYLGFSATLYRHGIWNMSYFGIYHNVKYLIPDERTNPVGNIALRLLLGFASGTIASVANIPFDVAKSRIQSLPPTAPQQKFHGTWQTIALIRKEEGVAALYRGLVPKVMRLGPGGGIMLLTYDHVYEWLKQNT
ncbi:hypothetical protein M3Y99_01652500 [Aphelenchoides fujianensis]|nr:hypothetical protein M3Y99_01652500 [Aphelenchoides fujianensis]